MLVPEKRRGEMIRSQVVRHIAVVVKPVIISVAAVLFWKFLLYNNGFYFNVEAENPILYMIIPPVGFIYVIFASLAVNSVFEKHKHITRSVVRKDIDAYLERRDQRLPTLMHILIAMPSLILLFLAMTYHYVDYHAGVTAVFAVTLVVSLTWLVIYELDNTHQRPHFKKKTPAHWHEKKPEDHFQEKE